MEILVTISLIFLDLCRIYLGIVVITILLGWLPVTNTRFYAFLRKITDPFLGRIRGIIVVGMLDLTPMIALTIAYFIINYLTAMLS